MSKPIVVETVEMNSLNHNRSLFNIQENERVATNPSMQKGQRDQTDILRMLDTEIIKQESLIMDQPSFPFESGQEMPSGQDKMISSESESKP